MEKDDLELYTQLSSVSGSVLCNQWGDATSEKETEKALQKKEIKYKLKL